MLEPLSANSGGSLLDPLGVKCFALAKIKEDIVRVFSLALLLCVLLLAPPVLAQEQRGAIEGAVTDASGAVLPGVTIEARSPALIGVASTVTDPAGLFRFPGLPTGVYEVSASLVGFNPAKAPNIQLALGQILKVNLTMTVGGIAEVVSVVAESPLIDVKQSASFVNFRGEFLEKLPRGRDFTSIVSIASGANDERKLAGISIDGASGSENRFILDGVDTTNLQTGQSGKKMVTDVIEEVQVKSSGYNAEFGGAMGGVVNVISKTGSNQWRGDAGVYFSGSSLDASPRSTLRLNLVDDRIAEYITYPEDGYSRWEPIFTLGGPIARDRLWFFTSYAPELLSTDRTVTFNSTGQSGTFTSQEKTHSSFSNISTQLGGKMRVKFGVNVNPYFQRGRLPALDGTGNPAADWAALGLNTPNYAYSGNLDYIPSSKLYLAVRGGYFKYDSKDLGIPNQVWHTFSGSNMLFPDIPPAYKRASGFNDVPTNSAISKDLQARLSMTADVTYYASFGGQHTFKGGVQIDRITNDVVRGEQKPHATLYWGRTLTTLDGRRVSGTYGYYRIREYVTTGDVRGNDIGLFIQDSWTVNKNLTINLGLRTEQESVPSYAEGSPGIEFSFKEKLAPRLGFAWDVRGDNRWKAYGSWGVFYDIMKLALPRGAFGGEKWMDYRFGIDTYDWPSIGGGGCPPTCPGQFFEAVDWRARSNNPSHLLVDPNLKPMRSQDLSLGVDHELNATTSVGVRYLHKQVDRAIDDVGIAVQGVGVEFFIANVGFGISEYPLGRDYPAQPKATRDYDSVEFRILKRMAERWSLNGSYTLSRLWGNYPGLASSDEEGRASPNALGLFDLPYMSFDEKARPVLGRLETDRPHYLKMQLVYDFPFGSTAGLSQNLSSGIPVSRWADAVTATPMFYKGRMSDGRTPVYSRTDLYLQHELRLRGRMRVQASFNVLNLFDQKTVVGKFKYETRDPIAISDADFFKGFDTQRLIAQQNIRRDPRFLMDSAYQTPRVMRLAVKLMF